MKVNLYKPQNSLLKKYIDYYYTLKHSFEEKTTSYLAFPSISTIVTAVKNAQITTHKHNIKIASHKNNNVETNIVIEFIEPALIQYEGETSEIVTLFKPLGINAFVDEELGKYSEGHFPTFEPYADYKDSMKEILSIKNEDAKIETLENYWLSKLKGFEHPYLFEVIDELLNEEDSPLTISEIAMKHKISRPTLNKQFKLHICKTPAQFRKILRFRKAMKQHSIEISDNQLTDIAYYLNYFDQSHMIKDFKALTGYSPKHFFTKISKLENEHINWMFL